MLLHLNRNRIELKLTVVNIRFISLSGSLDPLKSLKPVCACGHERAECSDCNAGYNQEIAAGRAPRFELREPEAEAAAVTAEAKVAAQPESLKSPADLGNLQGLLKNNILIV